MPTCKCGGSAGVGQSPFCKHCGKDWVRPKPSIGAKCKETF